MPAEFHFLRPYCLLTLLPATVLLFLLIKNKYRRGDWVQVCDAELLPFILQEQPAQSHTLRWMLTALAALLSILALAGPTWERLPGPAFRNDSALVIALDLSKSMDATDVKPSRISRARFKISDILKQRKDGQTALLVYSGDAFTVTPLTTDTATINSQLEALNTDIMPSPGSNTLTGMQKAVDLLRQAGLAQGHVLLITDGADAESVSKAKEIMGDYRLSVLALGTQDGAPIPQPGGGFLKDERGNIVVARLDTGELSSLASAGKGLFQPATDNDSDIERLGEMFNAASHSDKTGQTDLLLQQWDEKGPWLLLLVLPWAALQFRKGLLMWAIVCLLPLTKPAEALDWQHLWQTPDQLAQQAFQQQQYQQAAEKFDNPDWRAAAQYKAGQYQAAAETLKDTQSADGHYNRGNALAMSGQLQEAVSAYQQALKIDPNHVDAKHNKELVEKQLQEQQKQSKQDQSSEQKYQNQEQKQQPSEQDKQQNEDKQQKQGQGQDQQSKNDEPSEDAKQHQAEKQPPIENQDKTQEKAQPKPDESKADEAQPKEQQPRQQAEPATPEQQETQRANEQLLRRIPDQPTGLLKRKFKYQYGQREPPPHNGPDW